MKLFSLILLFALPSFAAKTPAIVTEIYDYEQAHGQELYNQDEALDKVLQTGSKLYDYIRATHTMYPDKDLTAEQQQLADLQKQLKNLYTNNLKEADDLFGKDAIVIEKTYPNEIRGKILSKEEAIILFNILYQGCTAKTEDGEFIVTGPKTDAGGYTTDEIIDIKLDVNAFYLYSSIEVFQSRWLNLPYAVPRTYNFDMMRMYNGPYGVQSATFMLGEDKESVDSNDLGIRFLGNRRNTGIYFLNYDSVATVACGRHYILHRN